MGLISVLWGIVAMCWMVIALIPVIGITNWLLIPFAAIGAVIAAIGIALGTAGKRGRAKTGLVLNGIVIVVATLRLVKTVAGRLPDKLFMPMIAGKGPLPVVGSEICEVSTSVLPFTVTFTVSVPVPAVAPAA